MMSSREADSLYGHSGEVGERRRLYDVPSPLFPLLDLVRPPEPALCVWRRASLLRFASKAPWSPSVSGRDMRHIGVHSHCRRIFIMSLACFDESGWRDRLDCRTIFRSAQIPTGKGFVDADVSQPIESIGGYSIWDISSNHECFVSLGLSCVRPSPAFSQTFTC
jgi:hypothetical protein